MLDGTIDITTGTGQHRVRSGDCLAMLLDGPVIFYNPTARRARYVVVVGS